MYISNIRVQNFRLLKDTTLDLEDELNNELSLLIGKNNSGKTSFIVLFEKFLRSKKFYYDDFPLSLRENILKISQETDEYSLAIRLSLTIKYGEEDNLQNLSDFIVDLDPNCNTVRISFEATINKSKLLKDLDTVTGRKNEFIKKNLSEYIQVSYYIFNEYSDFESNHRSNLIKKDASDVNNLINLKIIQANRNVTSSDAKPQDRKILSHLTTQFYNSKVKVSHDELEGINSSIINADEQLSDNYKTFFKPFLENAKSFLGLTELNVVSDLQSKEVMGSHSKITYGNNGYELPEHQNGLGYMNILYLLLNIEIEKADFEKTERDINLLFIEEPEAHTHPQLQYVFIDQITNTLKGIKGLQTFISTHSAHIVQKCNFKDIRYFRSAKDEANTEIRNFYKELQAKYADEKNAEIDKVEKKNFKFLNQYLTIESSELFFAEKIIFIEGTSEKMLLPYFISQFDTDGLGDSGDIALTSQNISILEVGANAKAFRHFLDFLEIKTLIITDLDTTEERESEAGRKIYKACSAKTGTHTSNATLRHYYKSPEFNTESFPDWMKKLKAHTHDEPSALIKVAYQDVESGYQGRSFEEAFVSANMEIIARNLNDIDGLKNKNKFDECKSDPDKFVEIMLDSKGKSGFASSILYLALSNDHLKWNPPSYIKEGLKWIAK
ncbi:MULTISPECIES: ATP-dependent nuclease [Aliivibrio]|uniref:ATP-dependent endonuclease n=1 Tax=Aliivibrio finisterrensis TaxID=511998 RepID=A0A4Q5KQH8_9GAMM|nr:MULTISPECIES: ATP-dependent endonuclease [Aliivibrio]MDD9180565.1 ATP-dependent endonuclease [Aliivibrio sp. A6]RYU47870.1 ATP-dependent endonuclease [Aliivibrio finisterrensis]RYU48970.1 ATP-dependent endonuclease [Aliivibrio finisterrensis]RYU53986.1 ATP-dependent endonuclease [Aliivibrio finisterrensis]RYU60240.1 ATP-dependent endonuclease [Aliivibrio finisterrensis]